MECVNEGGVSNFKEIPAGCGANEVCRAVAAGVGVCECAEDYIRVNDVCEGDLFLLYQPCLEKITCPKFYVRYVFSIAIKEAK